MFLVGAVAVFWKWSSERWAAFWKTFALFLGLFTLFEVVALVSIPGHDRVIVGWLLPAGLAWLVSLTVQPRFREQSPLDPVLEWVKRHSTLVRCLGVGSAVLLVGSLAPWALTRPSDRELRLAAYRAKEAETVFYFNRLSFSVGPDLDSDSQMRIVRRYARGQVSDKFCAYVSEVAGNWDHLDAHIRDVIAHCEDNWR